MEQRVEFALKALRSGNFRELCQEYGISPKTGYKWRERFLSKGLARKNHTVSPEQYQIKLGA